MILGFVLMAEKILPHQQSSAVKYDDPALEQADMYWHYAGVKYSGTIIEYGADGSITVRQVRKGLLHGKTCTWDAHQRLRICSKFLRGKQHGHEYHWWPNGQVRRMVLFRANIIIGRLQCWYPNGQLAEQQHYDDAGQALSPQMA